MTFTVQAEAPPLRPCADGSIRVGQSRVLLELVIHAFQDGATPEQIAQRFPSLQLSDVYAVVAFYLRHANQTNRYLAVREKKAAHIAKRSNGDLRKIRERLHSRRHAQEA